MRILQRKLIGDVVPHQRRGGDFSRAIKSGERLVVLTKVEVGIAEAYLQAGVIGSERGSFFQFRRGLVVLVPLRIHRPKIGVRELVEWIVLELLVKCVYRLVVLAILPVRASEIVIGKLVVRVDIERFLESGNRIIALAQRKVGEAEIVPRIFVFGIVMDGALEQLNRLCEISVAHGGAGVLVKVA